MGLDASTASAIAALVVACFALLIALAQVLQQYYVTGQLIRLCDSVVFGPLPGRGRRIWELTQFRFRVVYSIPQISLDATLWPEQSPHVKSYATGRHRLQSSKSIDGEDYEVNPFAPHFSRPPLGRDRKGSSFYLPDNPQNKSSNLSVHLSPRKVGEASWVSFWRVIERQCYDSIRYDYVKYDADRCPPDLVTAPMQVSMRDIIIMGLMAGMQVTSCSFNEKSVSMQGEVGTITSSNHPVLGPILHFTPRDAEDFSHHIDMTNGIMAPGSVEHRWIARTWGVCMVARTFYNSNKRRTTRRLDERWIRDQKGTSQFDLSRPGDPFPKARRKSKKGKDTEKTTDNNVVVHNERETSPARSIDAEILDPKVGVNTIHRRLQDGHWSILIPQELPPRTTGEAREKRASRRSRNHGSRKTTRNNTTTSRPVSKSERSRPTDPDAETSKPSRRATVEDDPEDDNGAARRSQTDRKPSPRTSKIHIISRNPSPPAAPNIPNPQNDGNPLSTSDAQNQDRIQTARDLQAARRARLEEIERDKAIVEEGVERGAIASPYQPKPGVLLLTQFAHNSSGPSQPEPTAEEDAARERESERKRMREQRDDEREERNRARNRAVEFTRVDSFWLCQIDIFDGFWATPWQNPAHVPIQTTLVGAATVVLEALLGFLDNESLIYTDTNLNTFASFQATTTWLSNQSDNCTFPAYAVNARGGVIAGGISWIGIRLPLFKKTIIPPLELLHSYDWQVSQGIRDQIRFGSEMNTELMRLDSWLSYVGRTNEISDGPNKLLKQTPALISLLLAEFELDFQNMDRSASEGGLQDIQGLAANVMDFLTDEGLAESEQLYVLVALLRTVKVGQAIQAGADTHFITDVLYRDVQAHLV